MDARGKNTEIRYLLMILKIRWMCLNLESRMIIQFQTIPDEFMENYELSDVILEYRRECGSSDVVQSLCEPQENGLLKTGIKHIGLNRNSLSSEIMEGNGLLGCLNHGPFSYTHLLQVKGELKNDEIVRGKTTWKKKKFSAMPFPP